MSIDRNLKILLVEDSGAMRKMERSILGKLGFKNVTEAGDGRDAVAVLERESDIGLVISDWNMPKMSGLELLKWIRSRPESASLAFIMATARGEQSETLAAREAGVSGFVPKPFTADDLLKQIEAVFSGEASDDDQPSIRQPEVLADGKVNLTISHIQITDHILLGVLKELIANGEFNPRHFTLTTRCESSWNPVSKALQQGQVDGAFILAPISMDLFGHGTPLRMVLLAHRNGSIFVRSKRFASSRAEEGFRGRVCYIPHRLSIHHMLAHLYLSELGLHPGVPGEPNVDVAFEVVPPARMPELIDSNTEAAGFMVAEPLGTKAIAKNVARLEFLSSEAWDNHPCCVVTLRKEIVDAHPEAVQEFVSLLTAAGRFVEKDPARSAEIGVRFLDPKGELGLTSAVLKNVLTEPAGIKTVNLYPVRADLGRMLDYMVDRMGIGQKIDLDSFVDTRFADVAYEAQPAAKEVKSELDFGSVAQKIQKARAQGSTAKMMLDKEGKYLLFRVGEQEYGVGINRMREIIAIRDITPVPATPPFLKGVINLRGDVMPVIDLRLWFGFPPIEYDERSTIMIVEINRKGRLRRIGILVESVAEIVDIDASNVEDAPPMLAAAEFILAMAKVRGEVKLLVDIEKITQGTLDLVA